MDAEPRGREWLWLIPVFGLLYGRFLLGWCPAGGDLVNHYLPHQLLVKQAILAGEWPFYNSMIFCGRPLMADIQAGVLYPPNWLHWLLPLPLSFAFLIALHGAFLLWGCWRLGRTLGLLPQAVALAAALFAASPFLMLKQANGIVLFLFAAAWWPWLAWAFVARRWLLLPWLIALSLLAGSPQITFYGWLALGSLALVWPAPDWRSKVGAWLKLALAFMIGMGLTAPQTAQTWYFIQHSFERGSPGGAGWEYITDGSLAPRLLWLLVNPSLLGDYTMQEELYWGKPPDFAEGCYFLPLWSWAMFAPLALALIRWRTAGVMADRQRRALVLLGVVGGLLALGLALGAHSPLFAAAYKVLPGFDRFRVPARLMSLWTAAMALLAAVGLDALVREGGRLGRRSAYTIAAGTCLGAGLVFATIVFREKLWTALGSPFVALRPRPETVLARMRADVGIDGMLGVGGVGLVAWTCINYLKKGRLRWLYVTIPAALAHLYILAFAYQVMTPLGQFSATHYTPTALVELLRHETRSGRVLWLDDVHSWEYDQNQPEIYPNRLIVHGIPEARGYDPVNARWFGEWMNLLAAIPAGQNPRGFMFVPRIARPAWLAVMGVETVISYQDLKSVPGLRKVARMPTPEGELGLYRNDHYKGMAFAAPMPRIAPDAVSARNASAALASDPTTSTEAVLVATPEGILPALLNTGVVDERFKLEPLSHGNHRLAWRVDYPQTALFCLPQSAWPGWSATIDGQLVPWSALCGTFMAITVPAGNHEVVFEYVPEGWALGKLIGLLALTGLGYFSIRSWLTHRRSGSRALQATD